MSKTLRKILTASSALLMIVGIGATARNNNVNAKRRHTQIHRATWHKGTPSQDIIQRIIN